MHDMKAARPDIGHLTTRPTEVPGFFTAPERGRVPAARDALEAAASEAGALSGSMTATRPAGWPFTCDRAGRRAARYGESTT